MNDYHLKKISKLIHEVQTNSTTTKKFYKLNPLELVNSTFKKKFRLEQKNIKIMFDPKNLKKKFKNLPKVIQRILKTN